MKKFLMILSPVCLGAIAIFSSASIAHAQPKPVPYVFQYDVGVPGTEEAIRADAALQEFTRKSNIEGWSIQSEVMVYTRHIQVFKAKDKSIEDMVVNQLKGCDTFDTDCKRYIGNLNRRKVDDVAQMNAYEGEVTLPAQALRYKVTVNANKAKHHYMEESVTVAAQTQLKLVAIMSPEFNEMLAPLQQHTISGWASFCNGDGCIQLYELKIQ